MVSDASTMVLVFFASRESLNGDCLWRSRSENAGPQLPEMASTSMLFSDSEVRKEETTSGVISNAPS